MCFAGCAKRGKPKMQNMLLEDVLAILGRVGTVELRKGTFDRSGTPGHKADTEGWKCRVTIAGHHGPNVTTYFDSHSVCNDEPCPAGSTALEAALNCLAQVEAFAASDEFKISRERYLASSTAHWDRQKGDERPAMDLRFD